MIKLGEDKYYKVIEPLMANLLLTVFIIGRNTGMPGMQHYFTGNCWHKATTGVLQFSG
jgi:hypothetical protein